MRKKIVHIITGLGNGGAEGMLYKLVTNMDSTLYEIVVISLLDRGINGEKLEKSGIKVVTLNMNKVRGILSSINRTKEICKSVDVIQSWMYHADLFAFIVGKIILRKKILWGIRHGALEKGKDKQSTILIAKICARLSRYVDYVTCCSNISKSYHESIGYKNIRIIPNGFNLLDFDLCVDERVKFKNEIGIDSDTKVLISIGRWNKAKNYPNLIKAISMLKENREDFVCLLVGNGLIDNEELDRLIFENSIDKYIKILGRREDIPNILNISDIFILHSDIEGFSNALGEAMLSGTFCIATDVGENKHILDECGMIVERNNPFKLYESINTALNLDKEEIQYYTKKSKERIEKEFSIESIVKEFCKLY